tara:strand:+ start:553 stop:714 length:162 start_codon:yes stop_codon:yes gene_type:complete
LNELLWARRRRKKKRMKSRGERHSNTERQIERREGKGGCQKKGNWDEEKEKLN